MDVESLIADAPCHGALFRGGRLLVSLMLDAEIRTGFPADSTVVHHNIPSPEGSESHFFTAKLFLPAPLLVLLGLSTAVAAAISDTHVPLSVQGAYAVAHVPLASTAGHILSSLPLKMKDQAWCNGAVFESLLCKHQHPT